MSLTSDPATYKSQRPVLDRPSPTCAAALSPPTEIRPSWHSFDSRPGWAHIRSVGPLDDSNMRHRTGSSAGSRIALSNCRAWCRNRRSPTMQPGGFVASGARADERMQRMAQAVRGLAGRPARAGPLLSATASARISQPADDRRAGKEPALMSCLTRALLTPSCSAASRTLSTSASMLAPPAIDPYVGRQRLVSSKYCGLARFDGRARPVSLANTEEFHDVTTRQRLRQALQDQVGRPAQGHLR